MALRNVVQQSMLPRQLDNSSISRNYKLNSSFDWLDVNLDKISQEREKCHEEDHSNSNTEVKNNSKSKNFGTLKEQIYTGEATQCVTNPSLKNLFVKHVKPKKRHEILAMAQVRTDHELQSQRITDVSS